MNLKHSAIKKIKTYIDYKLFHLRHIPLYCTLERGENYRTKNRLVVIGAKIGGKQLVAKE